MFQSYELKGNMLAKKEDLVKGAKELNKKGWKSDFNMAGEVWRWRQETGKKVGVFLKEIVQNFTAHPAGRLPNNWIVYKCPKNGKLVIVGFAEARKIKMVKFGLCSSISDLQTQSVL